MFEDLILPITLACLALLITFLLVLYRLYTRISPLLNQFTTQSGEFQLPKISIKQAIAYGIVKLIDGVDVTKVLGNFGMGKK